MADQSVADPFSTNPDLTPTLSDPLAIPPLDPAIFSDAFFDDDGDDHQFTFDDLYLPSDTEDFLNSLPPQIDLFSENPNSDLDTVSNSDCFVDRSASGARLSDSTSPGTYEASGDRRSDVAKFLNVSSTESCNGSDCVRVLNSGDQSLSGAMLLNSPSPGSCQISGDPSLDVARFLNVSSPGNSRSSGDSGSDCVRVLNYPSPDSERHKPASSQGSGNSGSVVSEALNHPSPDSGNCAGSAASSPFSAHNSESVAVDQRIKLEEEGHNCLLKRKKGSEDVNSESRTTKYQRQNAVDKENQSYGLDAMGEEEEKKKARLMRNRESAQLSRQRKKHYVDELEDKVRTMHSTIQDLNSKMSYIMAENVSLRQQLSGGAMCPPPVPPPGMYPHPSMAPIGYPWMPYPPYVVKPQGSQVPLVPIPRLKPQQPASAPKAKKVESKKTEGKTKKVASVSFLGLLLCILLFGGLVPIVHVRFGGMQDMVSGGSDYLGNRIYETHHGRVLTVTDHLNDSVHNIGMGSSSGRESNVEYREGSHPFTGSEKVVRQGNSSEPLVASLYVPRNDKLVKIDGNLIIHSIMASEKAMASRQNHGKKSSEETGLAVAGNTSPAIPLAVRNNGRHPRLYRSTSAQKRALGSGSAEEDILKSTAADGKLQQWFQEGLAGPMLSSGMCTEVFQFDVSPAPGALVPATAVRNVSVEPHQNATQLVKGRNRRILHGAPIPLAGSRNDSAKERVKRNTEKDNLQGNNSVSSMVVSVLIDPREAGDSDGDGVMGLKSLSRIFVVVLVDSVKYVTYSCMLPLKGSGAHLVTA
ncbi:BZIP transcription factor [Actinidia chinensis var. chinensis]|uniref:BZIP transcription factor n=1 Tax=Actinidia chinensis var. chinensis TaxID=1590841 RepID=A0A2R6RU30_ACTCC|nr:BZIP transcription factor [Actinidia chinensis var. chinensis]